MPKKKSYPKKDLKEFKGLLMELRDEILGDVRSMESEVLSKSREDASTQDISDFADLGTENFEKEFTFGLIESEQEELDRIDEALVRIDEGTYGQCPYELESEEYKSGDCRRTGLIPKLRLRAMPHAIYCMTCKKRIEEEGE
jgi:DnaK suppressor protein